MTPTDKPLSPFFGSGPCKKIPEWRIDNINNFLMSKSHRSPQGIKRVREVINLTREILNIPENYFLGILPGSATGAIECALWNLLGPKPLTVLTHDVFSQRWENDIVTQLKIKNVFINNVEHGKIPKTDNIPVDNDIVLNWNGSTSGTCFPFNTFSKKKQTGLIIADITSAVFSMNIPWDDLDASAFSWQKGLGGEAGYGMLVLSPKAQQRIENYRPTWPIPYLLNLWNGNSFNKNVFENKTINTISMMCLEDFLISLKWAKSKGDINKLIKLSKDNLRHIENWCSKMGWIDFLSENLKTTSSSTIVLKLTLKSFLILSPEKQRRVLKDITDRLEIEEVAYDILNHPTAPPSIRIWGGPTIILDDLKKLTLWLEWSFKKSKKKFSL